MMGQAESAFNKAIEAFGYNKDTGKFSDNISDFEIDGITFEVGGRNKTGRQIKSAERGFVVKDDVEYAVGNTIPIWMFGFLY